MPVFGVPLPGAPTLLEQCQLWWDLKLALETVSSIETPALMKLEITRSGSVNFVRQSVGNVVIAAAEQLAVEEKPAALAQPQPAAMASAKSEC